MTMRELNNTAHKILDIAEYYTQTRGFNAFSYKDIQNKVGIKTSSIHYYFSSKQDLALAMIERYIERFHCHLKKISDDNKKGIKQLELLAEAYINVVKQGKFCMCGMLASDALALSNLVNGKINDFFEITEGWISNAVIQGKEQGDFKHSRNAKIVASQLLAMLEGGMLIARTQKRPEYLEEIVKEYLNKLKD